MSAPVDRISQELSPVALKWPSGAAQSNSVTLAARNAISMLQDFPVTSLRMICYYNPSDPEYIRSLIAQYARVLESSPKNINALTNRARQYLKLKEYDKAKTDFTQVFLLEKNNIDALSGLAIVDYQKGNFESAEVKFILALKIQPRNYPCNMNLASVYKAQGKYEKALSFLNIAGECPHSSSVDVIRARIDCFQRLDQCNEAIDCLNELIKQFPRDSKSKMDKGDLLVKMNCPWSAKLAYDGALRANPRSVQAYLQLGHVFELLEDYAAAVKQLEKGLAIEPLNEQLLFKRALNTFLSSRDGDYNRHLGALKKGHPNSPKLTFLKGIEKYFAGHNKEAYDLFKEYLAKVTNDYLACLYMGQCYRHQAQSKEALMCYNKCIQINPHDYRAYIERADIFIKMQLFEKAKSDLEHCVRYIDLDNDDDDDRDCHTSIKAFCRLSYVYTLLGEIGKAEGILEALTDFEAEMNLVDLAYGKHLMLLGRYQQAYDKFESAAEDDGWSEEEVVMSMISCKRKLGTLADLEEAQNLLKLLLERDKRGVEIQIIKQNLLDEIKAAKAKEQPQKTCLAKPKKKDRRKHAVQHKNDYVNRIETNRNNDPIDDGAVKKLQQDFEVRFKEEQRLNQERFEREKNLLALEKKREAEIKAAEREIARKQRENKYLSSAARSRPSAASRSKDISLRDDFQKQKQKWLQEEQKAIKESTQETVPGPVIVPGPPIVTVVRNTLHPSMPTERQFAPEVMKPYAEVYMKQPSGDNIPAAADPSKKVEKVTKKIEKVILMAPEHYPVLEAGFKAVSALENLLSMSASCEVENEVLARAMLFNVRLLFANLGTTPKHDREFVDLLNRTVASSKLLNRLSNEAASLQMLGSLAKLKPFCVQLMATGLLENLKRIHRLHAWPQLATAVILDRLEIGQQTGPLNEKILLNYLRQECGFLSRLSFAGNQPYFQEAFIVSIDAISAILASLSDRSLVQEITGLLKAQGFQEFNGTNFSLGSALRVCQTILQKQNDLNQLIEVHILVEID